MFTCFIRYSIAPDKHEEFKEYARAWIGLIRKYGGTHHGYFVPGTAADDLPDAGFSFPGLGRSWYSNTSSSRRIIDASSSRAYGPVAGALLRPGGVATLGEPRNAGATGGSPSRTWPARVHVQQLAGFRQCPGLMPAFRASAPSCRPGEPRRIARFWTIARGSAAGAHGIRIVRGPGQRAEVDVNPPP